ADVSVGEPASAQEVDWEPLRLGVRGERQARLHVCTGAREDWRAPLPIARDVASSVQPASKIYCSAAKSADVAVPDGLDDVEPWRGVSVSVRVPLWRQTAEPQLVSFAAGTPLGQHDHDGLDKRGGWRHLHAALPLQRGRDGGRTSGAVPEMARECAHPR